MRERTPGYWQLRVFEGTDPVSGKKRYRWLAHIEHLGRSPSMLYNYWRLIEQLPKGFKSQQLAKVTPKLIDDLYRHLAQSGSASRRRCSGSMHCCALRSHKACAGVSSIATQPTARRPLVCPRRSGTSFG